MELDIKGLRVLVTAGGAGIGRAIVEAFLQEGAQVFTCDVDQAALATLPQAVGRMTADVADRAQVADLFAAATTALGGLDVLVNNAGIAGPTGAVEAINPEDWDRCLEVCLTGQFNCVRLAVPFLRASQERIHRQSVLRGGAVWIRPARPLFGGKMGRDRLHEVAGDRIGRRTGSG